MAATMLGQGKNVWQAEIDAAAELCDFWRFNCVYAQEIYQQQPPKNSSGIWNRVEYRPLVCLHFIVSILDFSLHMHFCYLQFHFSKMKATFCDGR
jgi:1-pyrroline-5-carboxylate dehydrogenase